MKVHFELGSIGEVGFQTEMITALLQGNIDSLGLNEQEFYTVAQALRIPINVKKEALTGLIPAVAEVQRIAGEIFKFSARLSRLHFHSFGYHLLVVRKDTKLWTRSRVSVALGRFVVGLIFLLLSLAH